MKHGRCPTCRADYRRAALLSGGVGLLCRCNAADRADAPAVAVPATFPATLKRPIALKGWFSASEAEAAKEAARREGGNVSRFVREAVLARSSSQQQR